MQPLSRQIIQAILGNGYELQVDRHRSDGGTGILLHNPLHHEEAFYFFTDITETQVIQTMAWQYCSATQLNHLYPEGAERPRFSSRNRQMSRVSEAQLATMP